MENNEKIKSSLQNLDDTAAESVAGGAHLKMIICCTITIFFIFFILVLFAIQSIP